MTQATTFRDIVNYDILKKPTATIGDYLKQHPQLYKAALLANHIFRAVTMAAFQLCLPYSYPVSLAICFLGSLFYRLTVETHCAFKFALPAFAGSVALPIAHSALAKITTGVAFASMNAFAMTMAAFIPLTAYCIYIMMNVDHEVRKRIG